MSPTKPKSTGSSPAPSIFTGGRRWAVTRPASTPDRPTAGIPQARQAASNCVLTSPFSTYEATFRSSGPVRRRPATMRALCLRRSVNSVDCGPPPCTITTRTPSACRTPACSTRASMRLPRLRTSPPSFTTKTRLRYSRRYGAAARSAPNPVPLGRERFTTPAPAWRRARPSAPTSDCALPAPPRCAVRPTPPRSPPRCGAPAGSA